MRNCNCTHLLYGMNILSWTMHILQLLVLRLIYSSSPFAPPKSSVLGFLVKLPPAAAASCPIYACHYGSSIVCIYIYTKLIDLLLQTHQMELFTSNTNYSYFKNISIRPSNKFASQLVELNDNLTITLSAVSFMAKQLYHFTYNWRHKTRVRKHMGTTIQFLKIHFTTTTWCKVLVERSLHSKHLIECCFMLSGL